MSSTAVPTPIAGNEQVVKCPCEIPGRGLQAMFNDDDPTGFPHSAITGQYDQRTSDRVADFQDHAPGKVTERGKVDEVTWGILTDRLCRNYDY